MITGICFPTPGTQSMPLMSPEHLSSLKATKATHLRINIHHARADEALAHVQHIRAHGFEVLPILDFDYKSPSTGTYAEFCARFVRESGCDTVELGNEPHTLEKMDPKLYATVFKAGAIAIRDASLGTKILIACEAVKAIGKRIDYFKQVHRNVPKELFDGLAIHPYRNPKSPHDKAGFDSRKAEADYYRSQAPGKALHVTETGWDLRGGVTLEKQAQYLYDELSVWEREGAESVYIYNWTEPPPPTDKAFGILDHTFKPRPAVDAIRRFQEERGH